ncbi:mechanosensitive ion channel family protein [Croceicoccus naphthovorans]|uniref:Small-conductance mechanosensitive channel n=1 Tax=Croceicoccus naphthovorans TaxID=1348774 RepID=A0A0G3XJ54_9SPHN|nr:mechanosensitive ion channel [Croceicoccus naphthovorans]AKM10646.1 mechanosensitive ion channel protein MscS [Croceicoccus naphthovorans]MBB3988878.1 small-conductance mechanosensitive channel [Croceicoccus naphthovorans]
MAQGLIQHLPTMAIALVIIILTWLVAKFATNIADRLTAKTTMRVSLKALVETVVKLTIWLTGLLIAATVVLPGLSAGGLVAGLGVGTVAIGFAFQDIFENFLAGVLIMLRDRMQIGDSIEVEGILGKVEHISLRETHIRQFTGELTICPNSMLFKNPVKILTEQPIRRWEVTVGVAYDTDLDHATQVIKQSLEGLEDVAEDKPIDVYVQSFGASSVDYMIRWWCGALPRDMFAIRDDILKRVKRGLEEADIEIPFPYITHTFKEPIPLLRDDRTEG